jgi:fructokinase
VKVLGFGAVLWDEIPRRAPLLAGAKPAIERSIGGAVFNVVVHLQRLGYDAYLLSAIGDDALGAETSAELSRLNVSGRFVGTVAAPTCLISVRFDDQGQPHYSSPSLVSWDRICLTEADAREIDRASFDVLVFGTLEQRDPVSRASLRRALAEAHFGVTYLDLTLRGGFYSRELLDCSMRRSTILKMNEAEARVVDGLFGFHEADLRSLLQTMRQEFGNEVACITLGDRGALIGDRHTTIHSPGYHVSVVDTVGSGDAFSAGLLYKLGRGAPIGEACDFANRMGALISSKRGALPDYDLSELPVG